VLINHVTGKVLRTEPITEGDDLTAATEQSAAVANAKTSLQAIVDKTIAQSANTRAVSVVPSMKDGHPIASIDVLTYNQVRAIQQPLD
jgi:putative methionine-R-sulfoxide reductase with GAF domain